MQWVGLLVIGVLIAVFAAAVAMFFLVLDFMLGIALALIPAVLIFNSARKVPAVQYGVVMRFGKRTGRILTEGLNFVVPFIDSVELFNHKLGTKIISLQFLSNDKMEVIIKALVQWRPDFKINNEGGENQFIENEETTITDGVAGAIKSIVGNIIGQVSGKTFIEQKKAVERYIDCVLRLSVPPHAGPYEIDVSLGNEEIKGAQKRINFYQDHSSKINVLLRDEVKRPNKRSELEERYGIDIVAFDMEDVDFSPAMKKAFEEEKQANAKTKGVKELFKCVMKMAKQIKKDNSDISHEVAMNKALVLIGKADNKVFSLEGVSKLFGG